MTKRKDIFENIAGWERIKRLDMFDMKRCSNPLCRELNRPEDLDDTGRCLKCQTRQTVLGGEDEINT